MGDLIRREDVLALLDSIYTEIENHFPSVEQERKKGEWIFHLDDLFPEESTQECSVCHEEESIKIQHKLDSNITMCMDECTPYPSTYEDCAKSMRMSMRWAKRSKDAFIDSISLEAGSHQD